MTEENKILIKEFHRIANKRWIKSISKNFGSIGLTFEKELGKNPDSLYFPDYYDIEIKCTSRFSRYPLYLFTVAFDGPTFPEINRIVEKYGYYDKDFKDKKVLFEKLNCINKVVVNNKYQFKLEIDRKKDKLFLCVYNLKNELIEKESFVYLDTIKNHLILKMNNLALIYASKKKINDEDFFRYYRLSIYKLKSFDTFVNLLNDGYINVSLISRISKSGIDKGRYRNKNLVFHIRKDHIEELFDKIYSYNYDENKSDNFSFFPQ